MNSIKEIFVALSILVGGGYAMDKIYLTVKRESVMHVHRGLPSLSAYTSKLTCSKIAETGQLVTTKCPRRRALNSGR